MACSPDSFASSANAPHRSRSAADRAVDAGATEEHVQAQRGSDPVEPVAPAGGAAREFDAAIFDMDGVLTRTAVVHAAAWKRMFDDYLRIRAVRLAEPFAEFSPHDYRTCVDGRPRYKGVETFLESRGIDLPLGTPDDLPECETVCGLGNRKNRHFSAMIEREGVRLYDSTVALIVALRERGVRIGLATSSQNSRFILGRTRTAHLFETVVDGVVAERLRLPGKPEPDIFIAAAANLGVPGARAIVVEDAASGVQAAARGGFALVIGIARENNARELREQGADLIVTDLGETSIDEIHRLIRAKRAGAPALQLPRDGNGSAHK